MEGSVTLSFNENTLEQFVIEEHQSFGYDYQYGPDLERDYHEVLITELFEEAMFRINPSITHDIVGQALQTIKNLGLVKLEELNATFHKYLIEGIPIAYREGYENKTYQVKLIDFNEPLKNTFTVIVGERISG